METVDTSQLKSLGNQNTVYQYEGADKALLERFENSFSKFQDLGQNYYNTVSIEAPEFTSLCPKTGQPDFAKIVIRYSPNKWLVESKSLKLYLGSFRNARDFHESCVARIAADLVELLEPAYLEVEGQFTPRGGIPFWPRVNYTQPHAIAPSPGEVAFKGVCSVNDCKAGCAEAAGQIVAVTETAGDTTRRTEYDVATAAVEGKLPSNHDRVLAILRAEAGLDKDAVIKPETTMKDLDVDSLDIISVHMALEDAFGVTIKDEDAARLTTVKSLVDHIDQLMVNRVTGHIDQQFIDSVKGTVKVV